MNKIILIVMILILGVLCYLVFNFTKSENSFQSNELQEKKLNDPSLIINSKKILWYRIITPIKNDTKGYLYFKTDDGLFDTTRINQVQIAVVTSILTQKGILYNTDTKSLIMTIDNSKKDSSAEKD
jgi:hypothetical protein